MRDLRPLLAPTSIAIVGASSRPHTVAARPLTNLQQVGYSGDIYLINPNSAEIAGVRCYASLDDLPQVPDVALIVLPSKHVMPTLESCARLGVKAAVVVSAGFAETGPEGVQAQARMRELSRKHGLIICGPNSLGVINFVDKIPLTFGSVVDMEHAAGGRVGLVSQSGGLLVGLANRAFDAGVNISYGVATGNEADLDLTEALHYLAEDPRTDVLVAVIESIRNGPRFFSLCDRLMELKKPLIAYKIARSELGSAAALSHTGALAGSYQALQAVFQQKGVIEASDIDDLFALAGACCSGRLPQGPGIGVITDSGGAGAIVADRAEDLGLKVPVVAHDTVQRLKEFVPPFATGEVSNPFDATAAISENPASVGPMSQAFLDDPSIDGLVVITAGSGEPGKARFTALLEHVSSTEKPIFGVTLAGSSATLPYEALRSGNLPAYHSSGKAVESMAALLHFSRAIERHRARSQSGHVSGLKADFLDTLEGLGKAPTEYDSKCFLKQCGIPVVDEWLATSSEEAVSHAEILGYPVVLKIQSPQIIHKTEAGGIRLNLTNSKAVETAYEAIMRQVKEKEPAADITGILVSQMLSTPLELIAGIHKDPTFGPLVLFGLGGIWVEVFDEAAMRPAPLTPEDVVDMVDQLHGVALLKGARNMPAVKPEAISSLLLTLSDIAMAAGDSLTGIDINPLVPTVDGDLIALDATVYRKS
ncbi:MAG: acetate--CoA ligase family protein [Acidobacteriota bacterium]